MISNIIQLFITGVYFRDLVDFLTIGDSFSKYSDAISTSVKNGWTSKHTSRFFGWD